jgi:predicted ATPase/DNA-binding SARP family transcriptional activator
VEFRLLGPLEVVGDDGSTVALGGPRPRALLTLLLLNANEVVSIDRLLDGIWGEKPPPTRQSALQVHVHSLRKALGPDRIVTRAPGYLLRVHEGELDVDRFERLVADGSLREALALWRGPALADVAYESFAQAEAARLEESRLAALEASISADLEAGRHDALVGELDALVGAHPHHERLRAHHMLALYRSGRQADALESFQAARAALRELGLDPSSELRVLQQAILRQDHALDPVPAAAPSPGRLSPPSDLIGRELEVTAVGALLRRTEVRLVTLTGTGGTGKTRLALAAADEVGGTAFVDLSLLSDAELFLPTVAAAVGADEASSESIAARLTAGDTSPLLVLDNLEHLPEAHPLVGDLLAAEPRLRVLATSRVPMRLRLEHEYRVPPLGLPEQGADTPDRIASADAVRLYVERVRAVIPAFQLGVDNAASVARICRALDGLPLAIELAAARVRVLGPDGTAKRLGERLALLARNAPDLPPRQRSLRATIDWSYDLLDEETRAVFRALGAFTGSVPLDAVEAVHGADATNGLEALLDAGLVVHEPDAAGEPRFDMLETIREYALSMLLVTGEEEVARERHLDHFLSLVERYTAQEQDTGLPPALLDAAEADLADIRAALAWAETRDDSERQLRMVLALRFWFFTRGDRKERHRAVTAALERSASAPSALRARIVVEAGNTAGDEGDYDRALALYQSALPALEEAGDLITIGLAYSYMGGSFERTGRNDEAIASYDRAGEIFRETGAERRLGHNLTQLALVLTRKQEYEEARALLLEALVILERKGSSRSLAYTLYMIAGVHGLMEDRGEAARYASRALDETHMLGLNDLLGYELVLIADLAHEQAPEQSARLLGAARESFQRAGARIQHADATRVAEMEATLRRQLGDEPFAELVGAGALLPLEDAVALAKESLAAVA